MVDRLVWQKLCLNYATVNEPNHNGCGIVRTIAGIERESEPTVRERSLKVLGPKKRARPTFAPSELRCARPRQHAFGAACWRARQDSNLRPPA